MPDDEFDYVLECGHLRVFLDSDTDTFKWVNISSTSSTRALQNSRWISVKKS